MTRIFCCSLAAIALALTTGCRAVPSHTDPPQPHSLSTNAPSASGTNAISEERQWYSVVLRPPPDFKPIHFYEKINPVWWLQNRDEPHPPAWFEPGGKHREFKWWLRNPIHNLSFYVIGVVDKTTVRSGRFPLKASVYGHWNVAVSRRRILYLPYVSYSNRHGFNFYFGWRPHGNFGIKLNHEKPEAPKTKPAKVPEDKPPPASP